MRVIHIAPTSFGSDGLLGGGERYPVELAKALRAEVDCELITFGRQGSDERMTGGLRVRTLRSWGNFKRHPAQPIAPSMIKAIEGADIVHVHQMCSLPSKLAALVTKIRGQRLVVTDHGFRGSTWVGTLPRFFDRFLTVSEYSARVLKASPRRTRVIYGGGDPGTSIPLSAREKRDVLFVGRLTPHKGIDHLIEALPPNARLLIVGSEGHDPRPPESAYPRLLRILAAGKDIHFLGSVPDAELSCLYRSAAVLALPSVERTCYGRNVPVSELLGLVALEAMANGTPVLGSRLGGIPEIVQNGVTGFLVEPGNWQELRARLSELLEDPPLAKRLGQNARDMVAERFTWAHCAERCLAAYGELLAS